MRCTDLTGQPTGDELNHFIAALSSELAAEAAPLTKYTINAHAGAPNGDGLVSDGGSGAGCTAQGLPRACRGGGRAGARRRCTLTPSSLC